MRKLNAPIALIALYWWGLETSYFGWNATPGSTTELFADGLALVLLAAAFAFPQRAAVQIEVRNG
ncbi:hypothetical protein LL972_20390 [Xanthomonas campestris pv. asclepiadis]|uniref:hypothetical protein n=1 Tax=Xanthomonas campestris TaxID=339 RepID=UPI001E2DB0FF|nr:hypothetical protein [Xanthomonas campestris]MCC4618320.1 hypothetical protein [Xanthomonas campestris pv. asclepiadis]